MAHFLRTAGLALALSFSALLPQAHAVSLSLTGASPLVLPNNFDGTYDGYAKGSNVNLAGLSISGPGQLKFTFLGFEAGYNNTFEFNKTELFRDHTTAAGATATGEALASGLINFLFRSNAGEAYANGAGLFHNASMAVALLNPHTAYLFFNDNCTCDADYDDMVVKVSAVPLPGALPLFLLGVAGLGAAKRYRTKRSLA